MHASERFVLARLDRRRIVRAGGLAGAAGLLATPGGARWETTLTVDKVCDDDE